MVDNNNNNNNNNSNQQRWVISGKWRRPLSIQRTIVDGSGSLSTPQGTIVDGRDQANQQTKKYSFPFYLSQIEFMRPKVMKNEGVSGSNWSILHTCLLQSHEFRQSQGLSITHWIHGDIWWDPSQFLFSGQTGFYNGNFSPQEQFLAWNRTSETYLLTPIPQT
jgi:hypothetical protein